MSTVMTRLAVSNKSVNYLSFFTRRKDSKACFVSSTASTATPLVVIRKPYCSSLKCSAKVCDDDPNPIVRRTGNYKPPLWDFDYVQSLTSKYKEERYSKRACELIKQVKKMLAEDEMKPIHQLELIDNLHRLCISYHFEDEIKQILNSLYHHHHNGKNNYYHHDQKDLYSAALGFRLLRQHGFTVSQDVFDSFKNEKGEFTASLGDDTKGLLQLYEASFVLTQGEKTLELAREYSTNLLQKKVLDHHSDDENGDLLLMVRRALELPSHWSVQRPNARWFIDVYGKRPNMNPILLELAKLDFNIVQATHQQELKHVSSWCEKTCLAKILPFARDRVVENYLWSAAIFDDMTQNGSYSRIMATKVNVFITIIDDIFDVYGTLDELEIFNDVIQRWDIEALDKLPHYMQICFLALNNLVDELAYNVLKQQGFLIIPHLRKSWAELCKTFLQEAKWYSRGYTPTLEEYMSNGLISSSVPVMLSHAFFLVTNPINKEAIQSLYEYHNIVRYPSMIFRLANDLGTSSDEMERGDVPKAVECYMNESGVDREVAREYIRSLMYETWKKMNGELRVITDSPLQRDFVRSAVNVVRMAQYMYQHGDGHGIQFREMKHRISSLLFEPFALLE